MRSFASLAAFASIAFATVASALPAVGPASAAINGVSVRGEELAEVETTVSKVTNTVNAANGLNAVIANAQAHQSRGVPAVPTDAYHVELLAVVAQVTGLTNVEILTKALNVEHIDFNHISVTALVNLLPIDLKILAVVQQVAPWVKIDTIIEHAGDKVEVLRDANVNIANAQATQTTGGNEERDLPGVPAVPGAAGAGGAAGVVGAAVGSLTKSHTARASYRTLPDIIVELNAKVQPLCHDLSAAVSAAASASAALEVSTPILTEIKTLLVQAKVEIEALVAAHVDGALSLNGKELTVHAIAELYATLSVAVVVAIGLVIKACAAVKTDALVSLVVDISIALAACISLGAQIAANLIVELKPFVECVVTIIVDLKLEALIKVLQIVVKA